MSPDETFDHVVVGAGAAGSALAARLGGDRVLLLEAGPQDRDGAIRMPSAYPRLLGTRFDWADATVPQPGLGGRSVPFPRGRAVGGSTSLNAQIYLRGDRADFDAWEEAGGPGWGYESLLPLFRRTERHTDGAGPFHGGDGPLHVCELRDPNPLSRAFIAAAEHAGVPPNPDFNAGTLDGAGLVHVTQRRGRRWSAADAYLRPALHSRRLTLRAGTQVVGLSWRDERRVDGVVYVEDGRRRVARARHEVILCAGAIGSPQLLMCSGIGPGDHLRAHGIEVRRDLPAVGQGLRDHVMAPMAFGCRAPVSLLAARSLGQRLRYVLGRGMLTSSVAEAAAFVRTRPDEPAADLELVFAPLMWVADPAGPQAHGFTITPMCVAPLSEGRVTLRSADPAQPPKIDPRLLASGGDLDVLVYGVRLARRIAAAPALAAVGPEERAPTAGVQGDAETEAIVRGLAQAGYHPAGTCRLGRDEASVVDPDLRVRGVDGLRVADASVMPALVRGHTQAAAYLVGERAADLIRPGHGISGASALASAFAV